MFSLTEQYTSSSKAFFDSRLAEISALTSIALQGAEKIVALNIAVAKASADDSTATAKDFLAAKDPQPPSRWQPHAPSPTLKKSLPTAAI